MTIFWKCRIYIFPWKVLLPLTVVNIRRYNFFLNFEPKANVVYVFEYAKRYHQSKFKQWRTLFIARSIDSYRGMTLVLADVSVSIRGLILNLIFVCQSCDFLLNICGAPYNTLSISCFLNLAAAVPKVQNVKSTRKGGAETRLGDYVCKRQRHPFFQCH